MSEILSRKDDLFDVEQETISTTALNNQSLWNLDTNWLNMQLTPAKTRWTTAYAAYRPEATRTPLITFEKNESRRFYEPLLRQLIGILRYSTLVTDDDRRAMGIYIDPSHHPNPEPDTTVEFEIDTGVIRCLSVRFHDAGSTSRAKPHGVHGAEIRWAILAAPPQKVDDLTNSAFDTRSPYTFRFEENQRGQTVFFCLRWENTTGQKGPWSEIVSAIIP
jgi:hypothetical protein